MAKYKGEVVDIPDSVGYELSAANVVEALHDFREASKKAHRANLDVTAAKDRLEKALKDWGIKADISGLDPTRMVQQ
jgi:hypothetical protein